MFVHGCMHLNVCVCMCVHGACACSRKALGKFIDECNNALCMADMLEGEQVKECRSSKSMMEGLSSMAETHTMGVKAAMKKYADFKP